VEGSGRLPKGHVVADKLSIVRVLGTGGMGDVYEVQHVFTKHRRALKMLHRRLAENPEAVARFLREASAAGRIGNPHVVETFDAGQLETGEPYLVMELLSGEALDAVLEREKRLPPSRAMELVAQAAEGVHAAHQAGIVHRDLKPANLFVASGDRPFVKLLDFGISKFSSIDVDQKALTRDGALLGTPHYMSPEQVRGDPNVDARADVYALGVVLYECLSGERPFDGNTLPELSVRIHEGDYRPLSELCEDLPPGLEAVVTRAMSREPKDRYQSAEELARGLREVSRAWSLGSAPTLAEPDASAATVPRAPKKRTSRAGALAVGAILALGVTGALVWSGRAPEPKPVTSTSVVNTPAPRRVRLITTEVFPRLDSNTNTLSLATTALSLVLESLVAVPDALAPAPIERVEMLDGGRTARLHLRQDVWFHPHRCLRGGESRAAENRDVAYSIQIGSAHPIIQLPLVGLDDYLAHRSKTISGIESPASGPVVVRMKHPFRQVEAALSRIPLIPADLDGCESTRDLTIVPGTGPYRMVAHDRNTIELERWARYRGRAAPPSGAAWPDRVSIEHDGDTLGAVGRVTTGEVDAVWLRTEHLGGIVVDPDAPLLTLRPELRGKGVTANRFASFGQWSLMVFLPVHAAKGPLESPLVRRALSLALDRSELVSAAGLRGSPTGRILSPKEEGYDPTVVEDRRDLETARRLLAKAGFPGGVGMRPIRIAKFGSAAKVNDALARQVAAIGVQVTPVDLSGRPISEIVDGGLVDLTFLRWTLDLYEGEPLWTFLSMGTGIGGQAFTTPELLALVAKLEAAPDKPSRLATYRELERAILDAGTQIAVATPDGSEFPLALVVGPRLVGVANPASHRVTLPFAPSSYSLRPLAVRSP
jgi:serine/threonine protein kinase